MPSFPPVDFQNLAKGARGVTNADYPYAIKSTDLMKNFVFATLDIDSSLFDEQTTSGGHIQRRLKIPAVPNSGTFVLGAKDGEIQWIATEDCQ